MFPRMVQVPCTFDGLKAKCKFLELKNSIFNLLLPVKTSINYFNLKIFFNWYKNLKLN
jgi:hypothetical protein